jgi:hypothetical protein
MIQRDIHVLSEKSPDPPFIIRDALSDDGMKYWEGTMIDRYLTELVAEKIAEGKGKKKSWNASVKRTFRVVPFDHLKGESLGARVICLACVKANASLEGTDMQT